MTTAIRPQVGKPASIAGTLTWLAAALAAVSAVAGLLIPGLYRDSAGWVRQAQAADFVTLLAVVPVLAFCLWRGMTGARRLVALAGLGYLVYTYAIFGFSVAINPMTPLHYAVLGLSVWALAFEAASLSRHSGPSVAGLRVMRRASATFLVAVALLFGVMWLSQIMQAITSGQAPAELVTLGLPSNPVYALDLAFALPLLAVTGVLLLQRWSRAAELGLVALGWVVLMGLGVLAIFLFDGMAGAPVAAEVVVVISGITAFGLVLATLAVLSTRQPHSRAAARRALRPSPTEP